MADEAANVIGEFDEGFSNRQTWHNAALAAIAVWFEDEELLTRAVRARPACSRIWLQGFGEDGMWYEGENYHLFALRGQLTRHGLGARRPASTCWTTSAWPPGSPRRSARRPLTALPDHTFPARKDSRFGVSLAQPMYLELWEVGLARLGDERVRSLELAPRAVRRAGAAGGDVRLLPARGRRARARRPAHPRGSLVVVAAGDGAVAARRAGAVDARAPCCSKRQGLADPPRRATATPASSAAATAAATATPTGCI